MYSAQLLDHFENPRKSGLLPPPAQVADSVNPVCGDILRLSVLWDGDQIREARFQAKGCTACVAMGSALTELLEGRSRAGVRALSEADIDTALGGLISESKHVAVLAMDALRVLLATPAP
jgi:NifU-like protein involved in Fe-S cluster formation